MDFLSFVAVIVVAAAKFVVSSVIRIRLNTSDTVNIGTWGQEEHCPDGSYANAFQIKDHKYHGAVADDSGINAIKIFCSTGEHLTSLEGSYGNYKDKKTCVEGYLNSYRLQAYEIGSTWDDKTGATNIQMECSDNISELDGGGGHPGYATYRHWVTCPKDWVISGLQSRVDIRVRGFRKDLRGLTDLRLWCTQLHLNECCEHENMTSTCPDLYTPINGQCFQVVLESLPWAQAQQECQDRGGRLAEPKEIKKFFGYLSDMHNRNLKTYWVGALKDKHGYWKWTATKTIVDQKWWVETHTSAYLNPVSCAYVLPGHYKSGLHGGPCNETKRYICEAFVKNAPSSPSVVSPTIAPISVVPYTSVVTVAGVLAVLLLMLIMFLMTRKRLGLSNSNIQPELKGENTAPNSDAKVIAVDQSRLGNVIYIGNAPMHSDLVVDHPSRSPTQQLNVNINDKPDGPHIKALFQCDREISEEDKLSVSEHLGMKWCEVGRRMKLSDGQIENIRADHPRSIDRAYELLTIWHDRESQNAKVAKLANILLQCNAMSALCNLSI